MPTTTNVEGRTEGPLEQYKWLLAGYVKHDEPLPETARSKLFGQLVQLAYPGIRLFHSDLYHDARWIDRYVGNPVNNGGSAIRTVDEFYYGYDDCGTFISTDTKLALGPSSRDNIFHVAIIWEPNRRMVSAIATRVKGDHHV